MPRLERRRVGRYPCLDVCGGCGPRQVCKELEVGKSFMG